jgi:hypothetical protein
MRKFRSDGIRSIDDLILRCRIDDETGCWAWGPVGTKSDRALVRLPDGVLPQLTRPCDAHKAAWLLSGRDLHDGKQLARKAHCMTPGCSNPEHRVQNSTFAHATNAGKRGSYSGPERSARLSRARESQTTPKELIDRAADLLADGATLRAVSAAVGIDPRTAAKVRDGTHQHQKANVLKGASVFNWRP